MMTWSCPIISAMTISGEEKADCATEFADPGVDKFNSHPVGPTHAKPRTPGESRRSPLLLEWAMADQRIKRQDTRRG